jgi:N-acyl-D-aspartate/D-glutamate deacylase
MSSPWNANFVIKIGTLIDGTGGRPRLNGWIVICAGKIAEVGAEAPADQGGKASVIDGEGARHQAVAGHRQRECRGHDAR